MGVREGSVFTLEKAPPEEQPLYTLKEAARHLGLSEATLRSWVRGRSYPTREGERRSPPLIHPPGELLSFNNLIEANVLAAPRQVHGVSMARVRTALEHAQRLGYKRPLLLDLKAGLREIFIEEGGNLLALSRGSQLALREILQEYLARVERDPKGLPLRFHPRGKAHRVLLDPRVAFGKPVVRGVRTQVIASRFEAGESPESLAEDYGLSLQEVREAILFENLEGLPQVA